ncbi:MAG: hypothetical protein QG567_2049, partial [Campylobacterota bacterium]|nr:hypothetical protein [Campylobacterota bacterium]
MALFEQEFSLADVPLLSKARQNFSVIAYYNKPLVFIVDEISSTRTGEDKYLMKIKYKEDDGINTIELGTHPSLEGAKKFFKTQFLEESPSLVTQVKARANEVEIVGDN